MGEVGNVGGIARVYAHGDGGLELFGADVLNINASGFFKSDHPLFKFHLVFVGEGAIYNNDGASEITVHRLSHIAIGRNGRITFTTCRFHTFHTRRPGSINFRQDSFQVGCTRNITGHASPERASPHFTGHQVRTIKAEASRVGNHRRNILFHPFPIHIQSRPQVRRQSPATREPTHCRFGHGQIFHSRPNFGTVIKHSKDVTRYQEGIAICRVYTGQIEHPVIHAIFRTFGEEAGNKVALFVHPAPRRVFKHGSRGITKESTDDGGGATKHIIVIKPDFAPGVDGVVDFRRSEVEGASYPGIIIFQRGGAEHHLFCPVGGGPTRRPTRFDADTPGRVTILGNLVGEG